MNMNNEAVINAVSILKVHITVLPTTPRGVYDALLDVAGDFYSMLAEDHNSGNTGEDFDAACDEHTAMSDVLDALCVALYGLQGRGPDAEVLIP